MVKLWIKNDNLINMKFNIKKNGWKSFYLYTNPTLSQFPENLPGLNAYFERVDKILESFLEVWNIRYPGH